MRLPVLALSVAVVGLAGCSAGFNIAPTSATTSVGTITGNIHGGQEAIQGAHIYLFAVGTSGYGGQAVSLLNNVPGVTFADTTTRPGSTLYYVKSGSAADGGPFTVLGDYTCTQGQAVYLLALGGSPDAGVHTNSGIGLMAGLGTCPSTGTLALQTPVVDIDEVSTVATAYSLAGFATDSTDISSSGSTLATTGVTNAINNVGNILTLPNGQIRTTTAASGSTGTVPFYTVNTIANILASCVSSAGPTSSNCATLFGAATSDSTTTGTKPTDTASAAINIAHYPGSNVAVLYALQTPSGAGAPYPNDDTTQPNDFSVGINYTGGALSGPEGIAIDASGNAYIANSTGTSISSLSPLGVPPTPIMSPVGALVGIALDATQFGFSTSPSTGGVASFSTRLGLAGTEFGSVGGPNGIACGSQCALAANTANSLIVFADSINPLPSFTFTNSSLIQPYAVAIDGAGEVWSPSLSGKLFKVSSQNIATFSIFSGGGLLGPRTIAMDGGGNAWIGNASDTLSKFSNAGTALSGSGGFSGGGLDTIAGIAIDGLGTVWIANNTGNSVSHFSAAGAPISASVGYQGGNLTSPAGIAIDGSGNVWVTGTGNNSVAEFLGGGAPVITPIAAGLPTTLTVDGTSSLGTRP